MISTFQLIRVFSPVGYGAGRLTSASAFTALFPLFPRSFVAVSETAYICADTNLSGTREHYHYAISPHDDIPRTVLCLEASWRPRRAGRIVSLSNDKSCAWADTDCQGWQKYQKPRALSKLVPHAHMRVLHHTHACRFAAGARCATSIRGEFVLLVVKKKKVPPIKRLLCADRRRRQIDARLRYYVYAPYTCS
eukprot:IDg16832t1